MKSIAPAAAGVALVFTLGSCAEEEEQLVPIEDQFHMTFGEVEMCMPTAAHSAADARVPVTFQACIYRCLEVTDVSYIWYTYNYGGTKVLILVPIVAVSRIDSESSCDGADVEDPPAEECTMQDFEFQLDPQLGGDYFNGDWVVWAPYIGPSAAGRVRDKRDDGAKSSAALGPEISGLNPDDRAFLVNFAAAHPIVSGDDLDGADCHDLPIPFTEIGVK